MSRCRYESLAIDRVYFTASNPRTRPPCTVARGRDTRREHRGRHAVKVRFASSALHDILHNARPAVIIILVCRYALSGFGGVLSVPSRRKDHSKARHCEHHRGVRACVWSKGQGHGQFDLNLTSRLDAVYLEERKLFESYRYPISSYLSLVSS